MTAKGRLKILVGLVCVLGLFASSALGQSVLTFPRVISDNGVFTGIAVSNPTSNDVAVSFTAFLSDGTTVAGPGLQNPITLTVPAGGQLARQFSEIFGGNGIFNGWVQATSSSSGLTGFFLNGTSALTDLDGASSVAPTADLVLPFVVQDNVAKTELTIVNVNPDAATASLTAYGPDGKPIATKDVSLPGRGLVRQTLENVFSNGDFSSASHIRIHSSVPLIANEVVANYLITGSSIRRETIDIAGQVSVPGQNYVLPEFVTGGGWLSLMGLVNVSGVPQDVTLTAYKEDGTLWPLATNPMRVSLPANGGLRQTVGQLFGFADTTLSTGWIQVNSSLGLVSAYIGYGNTTAPSFAVVSAVEVGNASQYEVFSQVAEGAGFYTGLTVVNPGKTAATIDFYTLRPDGTTVGKSTFTVGPNQRVGKLFDELLPAALTQVGGWAFLRSSQPVVAATLFGTTNGDALANVPQQIPVADFVPPAQRTAAISGSVLSGTDPVSGARITISGPVNATTTTDASGRYIFLQLPNGSYSLTPSIDGAQVVPSVANITVNLQNVDNANFQAGGVTPANSPVATTVTPAATFAGNTTLNITVLGQNFTPSSKVYTNGLALQTTFISPAQLQAILPSLQLLQAQTLGITVQTPPPGGGTSTAVGFAVNPVPADPLIIGRVAVGNNPAGVAFDAKRNHALVSNEASDSVTVIDLSGMNAIAEIKVGRSPADGIAIVPDKDVALVANPGSGDVSVIDLATNKESARIKLTGGAFPLGLAVDPGVNRAYVANNTGGSLSIIDLNTMTESGRIDGIGQGLSNVAINPNTHIGIVTNLSANTATFFDTTKNQTIATIATGQRPRGVAIDADTNQAVIVNANSNDAWIIDMATRAVLAKVAVGTGPSGVAIHATTNTAIVSNSSVARASQNQFGALGSISVVDLASHDVTNVTVGAAAFGVDVDSVGQRAFIADFGSNDMTVIRIPNPVPRVTDVEPKTFPAGGQTVTISIFGTGFVPTSVVTINDQSLPTTYISPTALQAQLNPSILNQLFQRAVQPSSGRVVAPAATTSGPITMGVTNPGPGGGPSPQSNNGGNQIAPTSGTPILESISVSSITLGTTDLVLTLSGNNFNVTTQINVGGVLYSPSSVTGTTLMTVTIPKGSLLAGDLQISVSNPSGSPNLPPSTSSSLKLTVNGQANPVPAIGSVSPASIAAGSGATTVTVQGTGFVAATTASLAGVAGNVNGSSITFVIPASQLGTASTLSGFVTTAAPGGGSATFSVNVLNPKPTVTSFSPDNAVAGTTTSVTVTVTGQNFLSTSHITVAGTEIPTTFGSAAQLTATIPSGFLLHAGTVDIGASNPTPGGGSSNGGKFTITNPQPTLTSITPNVLPVQSTAATITLTGTKFSADSTVTIGGTPASVVFSSATSLSATVPPSLLQLGALLNVQVSNPVPGGGLSGIVQLTVNNPQPTITGVNPTKITASQTNVTLTVTGTNFVRTSTIALNAGIASSAVALAGARVAPRDVSQTTFVSSTQLTVTLNPPYPLGTVNVTAVSPIPGGGTSNVFPIEIIPLAPTITNVTPQTVVAGQSVDVIGTNFGPGSAVRLRGSSIPATVNSATDISVTIPIDAVLGSADVVVRNPGTSTTAPQDSSAFSITIISATPTVTSVSPNSGVVGSSVSLSVFGTNFFQGSTVNFNGSQVSTSFVSSTQLSATVTLPNQVGAVSITVSNPNGLSSNSTPFSVTPATITPPPPPPSGPPTVSSFTPTSASTGSLSLLLTVYGTNFAASSSITINGNAIATTFESSTQLTATLSQTFMQSPGNLDIGVATPGSSSLDAGQFTVTAALVPIFSGINPANGAQGAVVPVTFTGTNLLATSAVTLTGGGVTVSNLTIVNATTVTATLTIAANATTGARNVYIGTPLFQTGAQTFTVTVATSPSGGYSNDFDPSPSQFSGLAAAGTLSSISAISLPTDGAGLTSPNYSTWLGPIGNGVNKVVGQSEIVNLSLTGLQPGTTYDVAFDLLIGGSWDGSAGGFGPDEWKLTATSGVDSTTLVDATFSNCGVGNQLCGASSPQSYSDATPLAGISGSFAPTTGADFSSDTDSNYANDYAIYYFGHGAGNPILRFTAEASTTTLSFARVSGSTDSSDEYWALDNIIVRAIGPVATVNVETAADGTGAVVAAQNVSSGNSITAYAIARDASGNFIANVAASWSLTNVIGGVANGDLVPATGNTSAVFTGHLVGSTSINAAGTGAANGLNSNSGTLTVLAGAASAIAFTQAPASAVTNTTISPSPAVAIQDAAGNIVTTATNAVTISLGAGSPSATLIGTTNVNAVSGIATFSGLSINNAGVGYSLSASAVGVQGTATSATFAVTTSGPATVTVETAANGTGTVVPSQNIASGNSITVYAITRDASGNFIANIAVTWSLTNVTGGIANGDLSPVTGNKSAVFTGHGTGNAKINAAVGGLNGSSGTLTVVAGAATGIAFTQAPASAVTNTTLSPSPAVAIQDAAGNVVTTATNGVTISLGTGSPSATLSGTTNVNAVSGVATFPGLSINNAGVGYSLSATASGVQGTATSATFAVTTSGPAVATLTVETAANGTGTVVPSQNIASGNSITVYAITRDSSGSFIANVAATWTLTNVTGSVVNSDLAASGNTTSAVFTGHGTGGAVITATAASLGVPAGTSGTLTVVPPAPTITSQSQTTGPLSGGQRVVFSGANINSTQISVTFGGTSGIGAQRLSTTQIAVYTPTHAAGVVNLVVNVGGTSIPLSNTYNYASGVVGSAFSASLSMSSVRGDRPAGAFMADGRWIVTGGTTTQNDFTTTLSSTEIADPGTHVFSAGPPMNVPRAHHTATPLGDGRILVTGGLSGSTTATNTTELLDASGTAFTVGPIMSAARTGHTATLLPDGRVLIAGGAPVKSGVEVNTAELFDPVTNTFTATANTMTAARAGHAASVLPDGRVLIIGDAAGSEIFDPSTNSFSVVANAMVVPGRLYAKSVTMTDGRVLITGGRTPTYQNSAEIFDPATLHYSVTGNAMPAAVDLHSAILLQDGTVLVAGGELSGGTASGLASIFDPTANSGAGSFGSSFNMIHARKEFAYGLQSSGTVIFAGGNDAATAAVELYTTPAAPVLTSIIPGTRVVGTAAFTLDAFGDNFSANSTIVFNGTRYQPTTFISVQHISIQIPASAITASVCSAPPCTLSVKVSNPDPLNVGSYIDSSALAFVLAGPTITISPNPVTVNIGNSVPITISVNQAPTTNLSITVASSDPSFATVLATATILANQTATTVNVTGVAVPPNGQSVTITASFTGYTSGTAAVSVILTPVPTLNVTPPSLVMNSAGTAILTVNRLNSNNSQSLTVNLTQSRQNGQAVSGSYLTVPPTATIPPNQTSVDVQITGVAPDPTPPIVVTASAPNFISGTTSQVNVQLVSIQMTPALLVNPGGTASLIINLSAPAPPGGITINFSSDNTGSATVVQSITIPVGQMSATALVTGGVSGNAHVTATSPGFPQLTSQIQVQNVLLSFVPGSATFFTGAAYAQTVGLTMNTQALAGGQVITLTSSDPTIATVPASVVIQAGLTTANVTVTGTGSGTAVITANSSGLNSGTFSAFVVSTSFYVQGQNREFSETTSTGIRQGKFFYLSGTAPIGGVTATITSSDPTRLLVAPCDPVNPQSSTCIGATPQVSTQVTVPSGQNYAYFDLVGQGIAGTEVRLSTPTGVTQDPATGDIYIAEYQGNVIRKISGFDGTISTFAGNGINGSDSGDGGSANQAVIAGPRALAIFNNKLYVVSYSRNSVRAIDLTTPFNINTVVPSTLAANDASHLSNPSSIAFDGAGNMFITSFSNRRLYRFSAGTLTVWAGGGAQAATTTGIDATLINSGRIGGVAIDSTGNIYYTDYDNHLVNQIDSTGNRIVARIVGNGSCLSSTDVADALVSGRLCNPSTLAVDTANHFLYVSDQGNQQIVRITLNTTEPSSQPRAYYRYVGTGNAGCCNDGLNGRAALINSAEGPFVSQSGDLYFGDQSNNRVRVISFATAVVQTVAGGGNADTTTIVQGLPVSSGDGGPASSLHLSISAPNFATRFTPIAINQSQWQIFGISSTTNTTSSTFTYSVRPNNNGSDRMAADTPVNMTSSDATVFTVPAQVTLQNNSNSIQVTATTTSTGGSATVTVQPTAPAFVASAASPLITVLPPAMPNMAFNGNIGSGTMFTATGIRRSSYYVSLPGNVSVPHGGQPVNVNITSSDASRVQLAVCDPSNFQTNACTGTSPGAGITVTIPPDYYYAYFDLIGSSTTTSPSALSSPVGVTTSGSKTYIADSSNYSVRLLQNNVLSTVLGMQVNGSPITTTTLGSTATGSTGSALHATDVKVDAGGNLLVSADNAHGIYRVTPGNAISVVAGSLTPGQPGFADGALGTNRLNNPAGIAIGADGSLYIADFNNRRVRKVSGAGSGVVATNGTMSTIAGNGTSTAPTTGGAQPTSVGFGRIYGVAVDQTTNDVYFSDYDNHRIWKFAQPQGGGQGALVLVAGTGTSGFNGDNSDATLAQLSNPALLHLDGNFLYFSDRSNNRIRKVNLTTSALTTVIGTTTSSYNGDGNAGVITALSDPLGVTTDAAGDVLVADSSQSRVRQLSAQTNKVQTLVGSQTSGFGGDGLSGEGVTLTASIAAGAPAPYSTYLPITSSVGVNQSQWQIFNISATTNTTSSTFTYSVRPNTNGSDRMAADTPVNMTSSDATVFTVPSQVTLQNNSNSIQVTATTTSTGGSATVTVQPTAPAFVASAASPLITVLPPAIPNMAFNGNIGSGTMFTATGIRRSSYYVSLPGNVSVPHGGQPVNVNITSSDASRVQLAVCDPSNFQTNACTGTSPGAGITVTIPPDYYYAYFDLIGSSTTTSPSALSSPVGVTTSGSKTYIADSSNYSVRLLQNNVLSTVLGMQVNGSPITTTTLGSTATGSTGSALHATDVKVDAGGNLLVSADNAHGIYRVTPGNAISVVAGSLTPGQPGFADGALGTNRLNNPVGIAIGADGSLYIADFNNRRVRKVSGAGSGVVATNGTMSTIAGNGTSTAPTTGGAQPTSVGFGRIYGVAVDQTTNDVYFSDYDNHRIWKFAQPQGGGQGALVLVAGTGTSGFNGDNSDATLAQLSNPALLHLDGNFLYFSDRSNNRIRKVNLTTGALTTVIGTTTSSYNGDGNAGVITALSDPLGVTTDAAGDVLVADSSQSRVRQLSAQTNKVQTLVGSQTSGFGGDGLSGEGVTLTASIAAGAPAPYSTYLPITSSVGVNQSQWQIFNISATTNTTSSTFTYSVRPNTNGSDRMAADTPVNMTSSDATVFTVPSQVTLQNNSNSIQVTATTTSTGGSATVTVQPTAPAFVASAASPLITVLPPAIPNMAFNGNIGSGTMFTATGIRRSSYYVSLPGNVSVPHGGQPVNVNITSSDASRVQLAVCDPSNFQTNACTGTSPGAGITVTIPPDYYYAYFDLIGSSTTTSPSALSSPVGVTTSGSKTYIADSSNYSVRLLQNNVLSTVLGMQVNGSPITTTTLGSTATGSTGSALHATDVKVDAGGNLLVSADNAHGIYRVTPGNAISVVAGSLTPGQPGFADGALGTNRLNNPVGIAIGADGSLYIADFNNRRVRKVSGAGSGVVATNGTMSTIAGNGTSTAPTTGGAQPTSVGFGRIYGVAVDQTTNDVYFSDYDNHRIWKFAQPQGGGQGALVLVAGTGTSGFNGDNSDATLAQLSNPALLHLDGNFLYFSDRSNNRIRKVNLTTSALTTVIGTTTSSYNGDGNAGVITALSDPLGVTTDAAGDVLVADSSQSRVRQLSAQTNKVQTLVGSQTSGFGGDGLSGEGVTLTASIAAGAPAPYSTYLPITSSVGVDQSVWEVFGFPTPTTGPVFNFGVRQHSPNTGSGNRMSGSTTLGLIVNKPNVFSVPSTTLTIANNGTGPSAGISTLSRTGNVVTVTLSTTNYFIVGQSVTISGTSPANANFDGTFTITAVTSTTFTYSQVGASSSATGGTASGLAAVTIGGDVAQILAQSGSSSTGIADGASTPINVQPVVTNVSPNNGTHGAQNVIVPVTITGRNFLSNATNITAPSGSGLSASITNATTDGLQLSVNITITPSATLGPNTLTINTPGGPVTFVFTVN